MRHQTSITALVLVIAVVAVVAASFGALSHGGPGRYEHQSIRGTAVAIHGDGIYRDMSAEVAPQGIAQDWVKLLVGVPLLIGCLVGTRRGSIRARMLLGGVLGYFFVTYLFYLLMGMY